MNAAMIPDSRGTAANTPNNPQYQGILHTSDVDFSSVQYRSSSELIPFREYKLQYLAAVAAALFGLYISWIGFILAFSIFGYFTKEIQKKKSAIWSAFSRDNNWLIAPDSAASIPPSIDDIGRKKEVHNVITGSLFGTTFSLFEYEYIVGGDKSKKKLHNTIMTADIGNEFTHILLDSKNNSGGASRMRQGAERISLEGNFDDFFSLYVDPTHHIDALSIITPDIMQTIMSATKSYDIEIIGSKVYLFAEGDRRNKDSVQDLFFGLEKLLGELSHKAKSFRPSAQQSLSVSMQPINSIERIVQKKWFTVLNISLTILPMVIIAFILLLVAIR